ncbi:EamA family transporter [Terriglobus sp. TAA 43]|uniref:EamA family transporter n=1 Tax=Terriglobus sp. TAA 43 TaxID=278961 RepID=UPI000648355E|nr:EamA family transporter [Terriglobus sp. TAA 43]
MGWLAWSLLSAVFAALTAILAKKGVAHIDPNLATAIRTSVVMVMAWAIALAVGRAHTIRTLEGRDWWFLAASGVATGLSWLCYFRALALGPVSKVAPLDKLSVVFVLILAWPLIGERLTWTKGFGGLLLTAGAIVLALAK